MINDTALCLTVAPPPAAATPATPSQASTPDRDEFARCLDAAAAPEPAAEAAAPAVADKKRSGALAAPRTPRRDAGAPVPDAATVAAPALSAEAIELAAATAMSAEDCGAAEAAERKPAGPGSDTAAPASALPWALALAQPAATALDKGAEVGSEVSAAVLAAVVENRPRAAAAHDAMAARADRAAPAAAVDMPAAAPDAARIAAPQATPLGAADTAAAKPRFHESTAAAPGAPALGAAPHAFAATAARALDATPPPTGHVAAPVDSTGFAPALATQVRWLVREGLQSAQLSLNPPEMGPLSVQIVVVDGRQTRIDFTADMAATRQAIEQSLPVLAAALDDSGLTLSGGGVHDGRQPPGQQHAQQQPGGLRDAAWHAGRPDPRLDVPAAPSQRPMHPARGLVDLVA